MPDGGYAVIRLSRGVLSELAVSLRLDIAEATGGVWRLHRPTLGGLSMTMRASREINNPFPKLYIDESEIHSTEGILWVVLQDSGFRKARPWFI